MYGLREAPGAEMTSGSCALGKCAVTLSKKGLCRIKSSGVWRLDFVHWTSDARSNHILGEYRVDGVETRCSVVDGQSQYLSSIVAGRWCRFVKALRHSIGKVKVEIEIHDACFSPF